MSTHAHMPLLYLLFSVYSVSLTAIGDDEIVSPETIDGTNIVNAEGLIDKVREIPELILIDSRITADHTEGFIEGSISLPDAETSCDSLAQAVPTLTLSLIHI